MEEHDGWDARMMTERLKPAVYGEDHETDCGLEHETWTEHGCVWKRPRDRLWTGARNLD